MTPPDAIGNPETRALLAVVAGARTVRAVAQACGWSSHAWAHETLSKLRDRGLVAWEPTRAGTLHATVRIVRGDS